MDHVEPRLAEQVQWHGWLVDDCNGSRLGRLESVYENERTGTVSWFLVRLDGYSTRYALLPPAAVLAEGGRVWIPYRRETVELAPLVYDPPASIAAELEHQLSRHFGIEAGSPPAIRASVGRTAA